jgi:hypothetical protein
MLGFAIGSASALLGIVTTVVGLSIRPKHHPETPPSAVTAVSPAPTRAPSSADAAIAVAQAAGLASSKPPWYRRRWVLATAGVVLVVGGVSVAISAGGSDAPAPPVARTINLGGSDRSLNDVGHGALWVARPNAAHPPVTRIRLSDTKLIETPSRALYYEPALATDDGVWLTGEDSGSDEIVARLDPASGRITRIRGVEGWPETTQSGSLWIAGVLDDSVTRVDLATGAVVSRFKAATDSQTTGGGPSYAFTDDRIWEAQGRSLFSLDPTTGKVLTHAKLRGAVQGPNPVVDTRFVWVALQDGSVARGDRTTGQFAGRVQIGDADGLASMVVGAGALWATNSVDGGCDSCDRENNELIRVDLATGRVTHRWGLEHPDGGDAFDQPGVFVDGDSIWVAFGARASQIRTDL